MTTQIMNMMVAEFEILAKANGAFILNEELRLVLEQKGKEYGVEVKIFIQ
jgi:hypothetical protein